MNNRLLLALASISIGAIVVACGGGGGGGGGGSSTSNTQTPITNTSSTYTASASVGEVLQFTLDKSTSPASYSYTIIKSSYGLLNTKRSGTLKLNNDGSFTPSESPLSKIYSLPNGLLIGAIKLPIPGRGDISVPIIGITAPVTTLNSLSGTYNYISSTKFQANNNVTDYGTLKIDSDGKYFTCTQVNIATSSNCYSSSGSEGTIGSQVGGLWEYKRSGSSKINTLLAFTAPNGEKILIIDFDDNETNGYGLGQAIASVQPAAPYTANSANGTWITNTNFEYTETVVIAGNTFVDNYVADRNGNPGRTSGSLIFDSPWKGFTATTDGISSGVAMFAGAGVYVFRSNSNFPAYYQVGIRVD